MPCSSQLKLSLIHKHKPKIAAEINSTLINLLDGPQSTEDVEVIANIAQITGRVFACPCLSFCY